MQAARNEWEEANTQIFWEKIATHDHLVQVYDDEAGFLNLLSGFVTGGILSGDAVVVIAAADHLAAIERRLKHNNFDMFALTWRDQYIPLDAHETLKKFMVNGQPDEKLFTKVITDVIDRAKRKKRKLRAFGEMVAILLAEGNQTATIALEQLWNKFMETETFCLFCAYPKSLFNQHPRTTLSHVCGTHSKVIVPGRSPSELMYQEIGEMKKIK